MRPDILNPLFVPVTKISGVGPKIAAAMKKLLGEGDSVDYPLVRDLLFHLPVSHIDRTYRPAIADGLPGVIATFEVRVDEHKAPPRGNQRVPYRVLTHDETGELTLTFFRGQSAWLEKQLPVGDIRFVSGKIEIFNGVPTMVHPDFIVTAEELKELPLYEPVYPLTAGLSNKVISKAIRQGLTSLPDFLEWVREDVLTKRAWCQFSSALTELHKPQSLEDVAVDGRHWSRLAYDELLAGQLALALVRAQMKKASGTSWKGDGSKQKIVQALLPYSLTTAQTRSIDEIQTDMQSQERMLRLLQGDVGSGKTIVALMACLAAVESGGQAAIMAPTEILARQHFATIAPLAEAAKVRIAVLTGRDKGKIREKIYADLESGEIDIIIGTHALFQAPVTFKNLALGVVDEQHRFGVHQRLALASKGDGVDILVMTATPIPRTLVLTYFGDMDVSKLDEKPPTRKPIQTNALPIERLDELAERVQSAALRGEKTYWICPLVEESDELPITSVEHRFASLQQVLGDRVGLIHGRMKSTEKDAAMADFQSGRTTVLVATTVVEVGVDVPDATIMIIEHAERFGLAQLHQLRGRVGRGEKPSTCLLLYKGPLGDVAEARIKIMRQSEDGFLLAEEDLKLRGEGEILGTRQSGTPGFQFAQMEHHADLLDMARDDARLILTTDPHLETERGEALRQLLYLFSKDEAVRLIRAG